MIKWLGDVIRDWARSFAWWVLRQEIRDEYIHRGAINEYTQWMSRDYPIMEDTYHYFQDNILGMQKDICRHREEMAKKHNVPNPYKIKR